MSAYAQEQAMVYKITSPLTGVVKTVYVKAGQVVKKGDLLLEYDASLINSTLAAAQAKINMEAFNKSEAKKELGRAEELYDRTVLSEYDLQQAKLLYRKAVSQYASAKNELVYAQWDEAHRKLYATFSGTVTAVFSYPGQYVNNQFSAQSLLLIEAK
ncbi:efflux RND transporter periplasmic adaptor subunit [sulfur-oxidizing endosymbiont of Gigantopelta aegis]|uniref:efflux RND transporter periplasmic adaptor subunit n=1 Tax=sulfur-oxidizing endosymbiont of Gigantopelta aegis TaxID=2794934 RepID=UPI0018DE46BE|nr:biotin/lipoyl-binding protein [sulfur-oxidizing endosymbiont of Gigantopelta aegis]